MTDLNLKNREEQFSAAEFESLDRRENGDIIAFFLLAEWITDDQSKKLSEDDCARFAEFNSEIQYLLYDYVQYEC